MNRFIPFVLALLALLPSRAFAGGFFLMDRGVRPSGRGGAFVAGADDPAALYYNPAGLGFSGQQLLFDVSFPRINADYARVDSGGNPLPRVSVGQEFLPIPSLAFSQPVGDSVTLGLGVWAPNAALIEWPDEIEVDGTPAPAPQRYSLFNLGGTVLLTIGGGIAYRPIPQLSLGVMVGLVTGSFGASTTMSSCDGAICSQPENPEYDALTQFSLTRFVAPVVSVGAIYDARIVRFGASFDSPYKIRGTSDLRVRIPSAAIFENAYLEGDGSIDPDTGHNRASAEVDVPFPWVVRAGVEVRPSDTTRIETALVVEGWARQAAIQLTPNDAYLRNIFAVGDYQVGPVRIPRNMRNTYSIRLGVEQDLGVVTLRAGVSYETSSFDDRHLTALTLDSSKVIAAAGISVEVSDGIKLDGNFGYSFMRNVTVTDSRVTQPNPIRPEPQDPTYIGNGTYRMDAFVVGAGLRVQLDVRRAARAEARAAEEAAPETTDAPLDTPAQ
jgi:long-chain fatty acid transport protein